MVVPLYMLSMQIQELCGGRGSFHSSLQKGTRVWFVEHSPEEVSISLWIIRYALLPLNLLFFSSFQIHLSTWGVGLNWIKNGRCHKWIKNSMDSLEIPAPWGLVNNRLNYSTFCLQTNSIYTFCHLTLTRYPMIMLDPNPSPIPYSPLIAF